MPNKTVIADLEKRIGHFYEAHSVKRVAIAALLVGVISRGVSWATYYFTVNAYFAIGAFAVSSLIAVNVAMLAIVPPTKQLADSKALLLGALKDPQRIKSVEKKMVKVANDHGHVRVLNSLEQMLWEAMVIPYFMKMNSGGGAISAKAKGAKVSPTEQEVMEQRKAQLVAHEQELLAEREKLNTERAELEARSKLLKKEQDQLENRISRVEASEEDLVRLKVNLKRRMLENENREVDGEEARLVQEKEAELKAKELALESVKQELADDRGRLVAQQTTLDESLQSSHLHEQAVSSESTETKIKELEARESEIEERMLYVASVENDLIDRLNQLSEREASVEQTEVEAGLRED
jgi:hypothetical protein